MPPEDSAQPARAESESPLDEPLDAIVYQVHPALAAQPVYPYGPPIDLDSEGEYPFRLPVPRADRPLPTFSFPAQPARYKVPQRFGMSAILGITTALAVLFGGLRLLNADPSVYLFFGLQAIVICIVQMFHGQTPRIASAAAGAALMPVFVMVGAAFVPRGPPVGGIVCLMVMCVPVGAFLGYLTGTCAAGVFLIMEALEPFLQGQRQAATIAGPRGA